MSVKLVQGANKPVSSERSSSFLSTILCCYPHEKEGSEKCDTEDEVAEKAPVISSQDTDENVTRKSACESDAYRPVSAKREKMRRTNDESQAKLPPAHAAAVDECDAEVAVCSGREIDIIEPAVAVPDVLAAGPLMKSNGRPDVINHGVRDSAGIVSYANYNDSRSAQNVDEVDQEAVELEVCAATVALPSMAAAPVVEDSPPPLVRHREGNNDTNNIRELKKAEAKEKSGHKQTRHSKDRKKKKEETVSLEVIAASNTNIIDISDLCESEPSEMSERNRTRDSSHSEVRKQDIIAEPDRIDITNLVVELPRENDVDIGGNTSTGANVSEVLPQGDSQNVKADNHVVEPTLNKEKRASREDKKGREQRDSHDWRRESRLSATNTSDVGVTQLQLSIVYMHNASRLLCKILKMVRSAESNTKSACAVRIALLPSSTEKKTKSHTGKTINYNESHVFHDVRPENIGGMSLRFRLYEHNKLGSSKRVGENVILMKNINLIEGNEMVLDIPTRLEAGSIESLPDRMEEELAAGTVETAGRRDSDISFGDDVVDDNSPSVEYPRLQFGVAYMSATGRLAVQVMKAQNLSPVKHEKSIDSFVEVSLMSFNGKMISKEKTKVRTGQTNPLYMETLDFKVSQFQLNEISIMVSLYQKKRLGQKSSIGWFSIGKNNSSADAESHWKEVIQNQGKQTSRWYLLGPG